ncbi:MAG: hypothetical protein PVF22_00305 [Candidatus Aminicenantes bacterium]
MKKKIQLSRGDRILFVCYGNHARSPMAEGLAKKSFGDKVHVESAGINPLFEGAAAEAVQVMKEEYGIDILSHSPKNVRDMELNRFDYVVAMDPAIREFLERIYLVHKDKLIQWRIEDPFSLSLKYYKKTAEKLLKRIQELFDASSV